MKALIDKFQQLTERERWLVSVSGVLIIIAIFYWLVWSPLFAAIDTQRAAVDSKRADLVWIQQNALKAIQLSSGANTKAAFTGSLPQAVNQTANRLQIAISRMQPQGEELKVWVDQAPFNDVLSWLQTMENQGIKIITVDLTEADAPGLVKVRSLQLGKS